MDKITFLALSVDEQVEYYNKEMGRVPHVYIDMKRELEIEEVVLGPKVSEPLEISNYLYYTGKVDKVTKSKIKYK